MLPMKKCSNTSALLCAVIVTLLSLTQTQAGILEQLFFDGIPGVGVQALKDSPNYPDSPDAALDFFPTDVGFTTPRDQGDDYGSLIRGYFVSPVSGSVEFFLASDDASELWISPGIDPSAIQLIAQETGCCEALFSGARFNERSGTVEMMRGGIHYFEVVHKEGGGGDWVDVGWKLPDGTQQIVPSGALLPFPSAVKSGGAPAADLSFFPQDHFLEESQPVSFVVHVTGDQPMEFQWLKNGSQIAGENLPELSIRHISLTDDQSSFSLRVTNGIGTATIDAGSVFVQPDVVNPTLLGVKAGSSDQNIVTVRFSEALSADTANDPSNYSVNNGVSVESATLSSNELTVVLRTLGITDGTTDYTLTINGVQDLAGNAVAVGVQAPLVLFGVFQPGADGVVVVEAENSNSNTPAGEHQWILTGTAVEGFSGIGAMYAFPNDPVAVLNFPDFLTLSPRLDFKVNFTQAGTYYVWYRGSDGGGDSLHIGLDGESPNDTVRNIDRKSPDDVSCCGPRAIPDGTEWTWMNALDADPVNRSIMEVTTQGLHTLNVWMREDGQLVDKILLTMDAGFDISDPDPGPAENTLIDFAFPDARIEINTEPANLTIVDREVASFSVNASAFSGADALPSEEILYQWRRNGVDIAGASGPNYNTPNLQSLDDDGAVYQVLVRVPGARILSQEAVLSVSDDTIAPELSSRANGSPTLQSATLSFSEPLAAGTANDASNYSIEGPNGTLNVMDASLLADQVTVLLSTSNQVVGDVYTVSVNNVTDLASNAVPGGSSAIFFGLGAVLQGDDGLVVIEAENFDVNDSPKGGHAWEFRNDVAPGFGGTGALYSLPDSGDNRTDILDVLDQSPRADFKVNFVQTGTYYLWYRGSDGGGDSLHMGIDGELTETSLRIDVGCCGTRLVPGGTSWVWVNELTDSAIDVNGLDSTRARLEITSAGLHTVNFWMRETGTIVDRILLTLDPNFSPSGIGPSETVRDGGPPPPSITLTSPEDGATFSPGDDVTLTADIGDSDGVTVVEFFDGDAKIGEATSAPYSITLVNIEKGGNLFSARATNVLLDSTTSQTAKISVRTPAVPGSGPYIQGDDGLVVIEAENFDANDSPKGGHAWEFDATVVAGFSGDGAMYALPDAGDNRTDIQDVLDNSPRLDFQVNFSQPGTQYIWFRGSDGGGDSIHIGLNGELPDTGVRIDIGCCGDRAPGGVSWTWINTLRDEVEGDARARVEVLEPGIHTVNVWMRENGQIIDRLLLTTNPDFVPDDAAPAESPREAAPFRQSEEGLVVVEAENFDSNDSPKGGHAWEFDASVAAGFSGDGAMYALPDAGDNRTDIQDVLDNSPRLDFQIEFLQAGTHYIWFRGSDGGGDSLHVGLNGELPDTGVRIDVGCCGDRAVGGVSWTWINTLNAEVDGDARARIEVTEPGIHTVNVWMRENGQIVDKLLLTTNPDFVPTDAGPAESPRGDAPPPSESIVIVEIAVTDEVVTLTWTGGSGPYIVQTKSNIDDDAWIGIASVSERTAAIPAVRVSGFFQILDLAGNQAQSLTAAISGANARPNPVTSNGTGVGNFVLEGDQLSFSITYNGLSGPATAAHIHGPASDAESAGVLIGLNSFAIGGLGASGVFEGAVTLTAEQLAAVTDGLTYVNIHTAANPGGEIRGQVSP
ncbi:MAG TPA: CHRD domain-containing protein [Verrucomicrobia bacterium]|nr:CHRD domain-containing protein [Verrucomicrobiota bacterium]